MLAYDIPGFGQMEIEHLLLDYNGTLARDGRLINGVLERLRKLSQKVQVHIITADTFNSVQNQLAGEHFTLKILSIENQARQKKNYLHSLGSVHTIAIGNGRNDHQMLADAVVGITIIQEEGAALQAIQNSEIVVLDINNALDLLLFPKRLMATLRD